MKLFNDAFCELLNTMKQEHNLIYLMGDYNINLLNYGKHNETNDVVDILCAPSFVSLINRPTWVQNEPAIMIEYIFTNNPSKLNHPFQGLIYPDITDHFHIIHIGSLLTSLQWTGAIYIYIMKLTQKTPSIDFMMS